VTQTITPRRMRTLALLFLAVVGVLLAGAGPASAHAARTQDQLPELVAAGAEHGGRGG